MNILLNANSVASKLLAITSEKHMCSEELICMLICTIELIKVFIFRMEKPSKSIGVSSCATPIVQK